MVLQPTALAVSTGHTNVTCNGTSDGSATVSVSGGTPGYTYSWTPGPGSATSTYSNLAAGSYTCTISDSHQCTSTQVFTVNQPTPIVLSATTTQTGCGLSNGTASAGVSGGTPGYTYTWNPIPGGGQGTPDATGLSAGTYILHVSDASGCTNSLSITITGSSPPTITPTSVNQVLCPGAANASASIVASGGTGTYTYSWNPPPGFGQGTPNVGGLTAGTYTASVTDSKGCIDQITITITQPTPMSIVTTTSTSESCGTCCDAQGTSAPSGGTPPYTYSWNTTPAQHSATATGLCTGTYTVCVMDKNGCGPVCNSLNISFSTGIAAKKEANSLELFPNPVTSTLSVVMNFPTTETVRLDILNLLGEVVYSESLPAHALLTKTIDMHNLNSGLYLVSIHAGTQVYTRKVLKQ
jgi:hypothetical protein